MPRRQSRRVGGGTGLAGWKVMGSHRGPPGTGTKPAQRSCERQKLVRWYQNGRSNEGSPTFCVSPAQRIIIPAEMGKVKRVSHGEGKEPNQTVSKVPREVGVAAQVWKRASVNGVCV